MERAQRTLISPEGKGAFQSFLLGLLFPNRYMGQGRAGGLWRSSLTDFPYSIDATPQTAP